MDKISSRESCGAQTVAVREARSNDKISDGIVPNCENSARGGEARKTALQDFGTLVVSFSVMRQIGFEPEHVIVRFGIT